MQAGTCFLCAWYCDVAVKWHIPPPNSSSSFEVSTILCGGNFDDIRMCTKDVQAVYHCLQVSTRSSSILSGRTVCSGCCQHWPSLSSFSGMWRSDGAQNENDNIWITEFCSLRTTCLEWFATDFAFIIHHTWKVPKQTEDNTNTTSLGLRDVTWRFRDCLGH